MDWENDLNEAKYPVDIKEKYDRLKSKYVSI
jgi:hypothetical protein